MSATVLLTLVASRLVAVPAPQASPPLVIQEIALNQSQIVFSYGTELWSVPRTGGVAKKVFGDNEPRYSPLFSPDGKSLAYTSYSGGDMDIYVAPATGGTPQRITFHPKMDLPRDWSADGKTLLFVSGREIDESTELYEIKIGAPMPKRLPMPYGVHGCYSPDGTKVVYTPRSMFGTGNIRRRYYRGGFASPLLLLDLATHKTRQLTPNAYSSINPHWIGDSLYFISDRQGSFNVTAYDMRTGKQRDLTSFPTKGITSSGFFGNDAVYVRHGQIYLCDLKTGKSEVVNVRLDQSQLTGRLNETAPRQVRASDFMQRIGMSRDGKQLLAEARGEVLLKTSAGAAAVNLTRTTGVAERLPVMSPDGSSVAYFSDESGEYQLHIKQLQSGAVQKISVESQPSYYRELSFSPDGGRVCFSDLRLALWTADLGTSKAQKIATSEYIAQSRWTPAWSPDGRWLAYSKALPTHVRGIFLHEAGTGRTVQVTDATAHCEYPVFDQSGRYLYFTASANARNASASDIGWDLASSLAAEPGVTKRLAAFVLSKKDASPTSPNARWEAGATQVDLEGIGSRIVPIPAQARNYTFLGVGKAGTLLALAPSQIGAATSTLHRLELSAGRPPIELATGVGSFAISADGSTLLLVQGSKIGLASSDSSPEELKPTPLDWSGDKIDVDAPQEWRQMFREAFRMMRDYFYDPKHHGQSVADLERQYSAYLPQITRRSDLNVLLQVAFGEISISHLRVSGGDLISPIESKSSAIGLLGADYEVANGRYRFKKILRSGNFLLPNSLTRAPLDQPGIDVREGDYLLALDDVPVLADKNLYSYFAGKGGRPVKIKVGPSADGTGAREYTVPALVGENSLRMANWEMKNSELVEKLSGGRLAYVHVGGWNQNGFDEFYRALNGNGDKLGLIVDQRFNGGGVTPDAVMDALRREPMLAYQYRYGTGFNVAANRIDGPKVLIINEANGSAAETGALMFKATKVGKVVGLRTAGAGIAPALYQQTLIDGGVIGIPNRASYNPFTGDWEVENFGVTPDFEVEITPEDYVAGRDPQLEKAIQVALDELKRYRKPKLSKPKPVVHPGGG